MPPKAKPGTNPLPGGGDVDRVAMLSLDKNGVPDQTPGVEMIGDRSFAEAATARQFTEQAVSAADVQVRGAAVTTADVDADQTVQDPSIAEATEAHEAAAATAEKAAASAVKALFTDDPALQTAPAASNSAATGTSEDPATTPTA